MLVLTFQVGNDRFALDIRRVREVVPRVQLERPLGSPAWLAGMFIYRGQVVPVLDLHRLLGAGECSPHLSSRIILVPIASQLQTETLVGLLAAQVASIREIQPTGPSLPRLQASDQPELGTTMVDDSAIVHLLDLDRLLPESLRKLLPVSSS